MSHRAKFLNFNIFLALTIFFILANSTDPDEIPPSGCSLFAKLMVYGRFKWTSPLISQLIELQIYRLFGASFVDRFC